MPLFKIQNPFPSTTIYIWKIEETEEELFPSTSLNPHSLKRLQNMKSEAHRKGFLAVRMLLNQANLTDHDLFYDHTGKPFLNNGLHISISHSHHFATIVISDQICGIDLEMQREKMTIIAHKFAENESFLSPENPFYIRQLTAIWGAKEAVFKIVNKTGISFNDHLCVSHLDLDKQKGCIDLTFENQQTHFRLLIDEFENFTSVLAFS